MTRVLAAILGVAGLLQPAPLCAQSNRAPPMVPVYRVIGGDSLHAYVFLPPARREGEKANAVLLFHGGGWSTGEPAWTFATAQRFADSGLVAVAVQYRLSTGEVTPIDALDDACAAFAWIRSHATEFALTGFVAGYGVSAGGHLVAATATVGCKGDSVGPDALLLWSPALDPVGDGWFERLLQRRATAADLSPARHVGPLTPPTCIVHGEKDTLTPLAGVRRYCAALDAVGRRCEVHVYPGVGHLLTRNLANQESDFDPDPDARANGIAQLDRFLRSMTFVSADVPR